MEDNNKITVDLVEANTSDNIARISPFRKKQVT